ncbi:Uncharacterised protein [Mannheimia haemolytica]|uniref:Uncharacterized protein n=1 Tax=Mannheimia haemolytica TaxID=75985 RepID=A0A448TC05_MANHA|nr:hypothetical protein [Mannheimia haemolytica]VEI77355.1 Uncharacterised protein [Mannheimia haemolytica]
MERIDYKTLKQWFLDDAYIWCQRQFEKGMIKKHHHNFNEWGGALDSFSRSFELPIENLMIDVIFLITNAGRLRLSHQIVFNRVTNVLSKYNLSDLISCLEEEEKQEFLYDLNLVLNNREIEE